MKQHQSQVHRVLQEPQGYQGSRERSEHEGKEEHLDPKVKLEIQERTEHQGNQALEWMYRKLWQALGFWSQT